jgi:hypothetical protein
VSDQEYAELGQQQQEIDRIVRKAAFILTVDELKLLQWVTGTAPAKQPETIYEYSEIL